MDPTGVKRKLAVILTAAIAALRRPPTGVELEAAEELQSTAAFHSFPWVRKPVHFGTAHIRR